MKDNLIAVPVSALATYDYSAPQKDGEKPPMIEPESGDPVDFRVRGSVQRIEDGTAFVKVAFINDKRATTTVNEDDPIDGGDGEDEGSEDLATLSARLDKESEEEF